MKKKDLSEMTTQELENLLKEKKKADAAEAEAKRKFYEQEKEVLIKQIGEKAQAVSKVLAEFKAQAMPEVSTFREKLLQYGGLRKGEANKGNFELKNDQYKLLYTSQVKKGFDERSVLAENKLKAFLETTVKKRDIKLHRLVMGVLERNHKTGDLDISNIQRLYQMESEFDDQNWREAIALFKESYNAEGTKEYLRVYVKSETGEWVHVNLNFASL